VTRRRALPQEDSDEESESEKSDEGDELGSDAEEEGMDSSDVEIVVPKEEEEDSDIEIVEAPKAPNKRPSPRKRPSKRVRPASSDEEEDSDNGTPPAPAPKELHKEDRRSGKAVFGREARNLQTRLKSVSPQFLLLENQAELLSFFFTFRLSCSARLQTNQSTSLLNTLPERWRKIKRGDQIGSPFRKTRRILKVSRSNGKISRL